MLGREGANGRFVKAFFTVDHEMLAVVEEEVTHDAPKVVDEIGVIEVHAPTVGRGRETAEKEHAAVGRQEGEKGCDSMGSSFCAASASGEASGCVAVGDGEEEDMEEVEQRELKVARGVSAMGLPRVVVEELAHAAFVFFGVVDVAHGVRRVGRDPQGL